jgi:hypothetical protein
MSAGRDKKARTNERKVQLARALLMRGAIKEAQLERRAARRAKRRLLKAKNG